MHAEEYRRLAEVEDTMWYFRALHSHAATLIRTHHPAANGLLLDAGCGTGGFIRRAIPWFSGLRFIGIDLFQIACELAQARGTPRVARASSTTLPFADGSMAVVVNVAVRTAELAVIALAFVPPIRLIAKRGFRLKLLAFPVLAWTSVVGIVAAASIVAASAFVAPVSLHAMSATVLIGAAFAGWRSRSGYGRKAGIPPGSLVPLATRPWTDINFYAHQSVQVGSVFKMSYGLEPMICIADLTLGIGLLRDHEEHLEAPPLPFNKRIPQGFIRYMDADSRPGYRSTLRHIFSRATVEESSDRIRCIVRKGLPSIVHLNGATRPAPLHLALYEIVFASMSDLFVGIPPSSAEFGSWRRAFADADFRRATLTLPTRVTRALTAIESVAHSRAAAFAAEDGLSPQCFLRNAVELDGKQIESTVLGNLIYIMQTATSDVTGLLHWMLSKLGENPDWNERLRALPQDTFSVTSSDSLHSRIAKETLRLEQSEYIMRRIVRDIREGGFFLPRGWLLRVCIREAHRNSSVFADPDHFDPDRFRDRRYSPTEYAPLGTGRRTCLGEQLSLHIAALFLSELTSGYDWKIDGDATPEFNGFHWRPGGGMRIIGCKV